MPKVLNCNPQSLYNKPDEFSTLLTEMVIDVVCISESWEREYFKLEELLNDKGLENFNIISNLHQRKSRGGRPALMINQDKFLVQNLEDTVNVPWGCEIVWAAFTPRNVKIQSRVKKNNLCSSLFQTKLKVKKLTYRPYM